MADSWLNPLKEAAKFIAPEFICPPLKRHIDYLWCFEENVQGLREEMGRLERKRRKIEGNIEEARLRADIPTTDVRNWSNEGSQKLEEATRILQGCDDLKLWNIIPRYLVGKSAKETAEGIAKLREEGNLLRIADPPPPAAMVPICRPPNLEFQSRKIMEEDIIKSLKDGNVRMIAICGAGGVGKTTMVRRIEDRVRKEFDEVVTVVVSQQTDKLKIQNEIAEILGLGLSEKTTLDGRAHKLRTRLMDSKKKLIIFDDVWKSFEPEDIGVPYGGCKIILTSRLKDVCEEMEADKVVEIQVLDKKEAWTLFREKSGDCVDDLYLRPIAEEVAAECKGLPIALATVGTALKNKSIQTWKDALLQLRGANPTNFPQVLENVYMPLKLSYDFLETESEKSLFLLCCLFPEDYNIRIEDLALLSFGLGMFEGINNIEDGRNRTYHLLERLRSRFLLMTGRYEHEVKMHDVVRDVAIFIGSKEKQGFLNVCSMDSSRNCNWMSVDISNIANAKLPVGLDFRNLRLLMILNSNYSKFPKGFDVNDICFKGMEELTVLYISHQNFQLLPSSLKFLKKLKNLHLNSCEVKNISVVVELASLEFLHVWDCDEIEEIIDGPILEGSNSFQNLELGYLWKSPNQNVSLVNLKSIDVCSCPNLRYLFSMATASSLVQLQSLQIQLCKKIEQVLWNEMESNTEASIIEFPKLERLKLHFLPNLLAFTQGVEIIKFPQLIELEIKCCPKLFISLPRLNSFVPIDSEPNHDHHSFHFFCNKKVEIIGLKTLNLRNMPDKISNMWCRHIPISFFHNLERLYIYKINGIRNLISSSIAKALVNLNALDINYCKEIIDVIEDETHITVNFIFPNLESLDIEGNCKLRSFCQWKHAFELPSLVNVQISDCPLMKTFTLGSLSTPKLHEFRINGEDIEMKDLNGSIHHFTSIKNANEDENKDEYNEDEKHEYKKETEGEENIESSNNNLM